MVRIISGTLKGRKLLTPPTQQKSIRPTSDRAREALFSILGSRIAGAMVIDLFAGTGAFGLEAFSRGANYVVFVDYSQLALTLIKNNIASLFKHPQLFPAELKILKRDLSKPSSLKITTLPEQCRSGFDIIFVDPPYGKNLSLSMLNIINNSSLLKKNGLLIVEERNDVILPENLSELEQTDRRCYGETVFSFYQCC